MKKHKAILYKDLRKRKKEICNVSFATSMPFTLLVSVRRSNDRQESNAQDLDRDSYYKHRKHVIHAVIKP